MKTVDYNVPLEEDQLRICFTKDRGRIQKFIVQYYTWVNKKQCTVLRIDNCHGFVHKHTFHLQRKEYTVRLDEGDLNRAFTSAHQYVLKNHKKILENYYFVK